MLKDASDNITINARGKINNLNVLPIINIKHSKKATTRLAHHLPYFD